jgi:deoxyribodipyrimidine photo-lyase
METNTRPRGIHWFRNDLRLDDNRALDALSSRVDAWLPIFIIDPLLAPANRSAPRLRFLFDCLERLESDLAARGVTLQISEGSPVELIPRLMRKTGATFISWGNAATPLGRRRDEQVTASVSRAGGETIAVDDHIVFAAEEIETQAGGSYSVYTPYRNAWWRHWNDRPRLAMRRVRLPRIALEKVSLPENRSIPSRSDFNDDRRLPAGGARNAKRRLAAFLAGPARRYHLDRDRPDIEGTSRLSPYLRFGALSIRRCFEDGLAAIEADPSKKQGLSKWLDELIWREFYSAILVHHPHVLAGCHRPEYDDLEWSENDDHFEAWCEGRTGYPFVDAGMRQLRSTGWMHNRLRMVVASFLTKDLGIDWRRGERFFFESLVDADPASNNGGWQWSASTGADAQPYFRIFNPIAQGRKWDPEGVYVRRWIPELRHLNAKSIHEPWASQDATPLYAPPIVNHAAARLKTIEEFKRVRRMKQ